MTSPDIENHPLVTYLRYKLAQETERADRVLRLLNLQTQTRRELEGKLKRSEADLAEYRHALGQVVDCEDACTACRRLAETTPTGAASMDS